MCLYYDTISVDYVCVHIMIHNYILFLCIVCVHIYYNTISAGCDVFI